MPKVSYWPPGAPQEVTVSAFLKAFETVGCAQCKDGKLDKGFEKVALYARKTASGLIPTHASRQLPNGTWTSKLGPLQDVEHNKSVHVNGPVYGGVVHYMKRPETNPTPAQPNEEQPNPSHYI
jgi:hypothetical protein